MLLLQPQQAAPQKGQTELRFLCALQQSVGNFVQRNISLGEERLRWSWSSVWARKLSVCGQTAVVVLVCEVLVPLCAAYKGKK